LGMLGECYRLAQELAYFGRFSGTFLKRGGIPPIEACSRWYLPVRGETKSDFAQEHGTYKHRK
jgi:hypothetical protein